MADKSFEDGKKLRDLEACIRKTLENFKLPEASNFKKDSLMTISTQNYREYLKLSMDYQVPIKQLKCVTEVYLGILNEWVNQEER